MERQINRTKLKKLLDRKDESAHKNMFGHILVIGGSSGMTGASILSSRAALAVGSGLVTAATWQKSYAELTYRMIPEVMTTIIGKPLLEEIDKYSALVIGPGIGKGLAIRRTVVDLIKQYQGPIVIDADGINALSFEKDIKLLQSRDSFTVVTPHVGELARFIGKRSSEISNDTIGILKKHASLAKICFVLKGATTYITDKGEDIFYNQAPNNGMATAGSGDVLAGIIGGLIGQMRELNDQVNFGEVVQLGVLLHSLAGKYAERNLGKYSMTAGSIVNFLPKAFFELQDESIS